MTFFYLIPVKGEIPAHLLELTVTNRLQYLKVILKGNTTLYNEYLIEGSLYDNVGHFTLCILSILSENTMFQEFVIKTEVELFRRRIESQSAYDLRSFAKRMLRCIRKHDMFFSSVEALQVVCQHFYIKQLAQHLCETTHSHQCGNYYLKINFKHCLEFVAKREVELKNGTAYLPCGQWKQYLISLFRSNLRNRLKTTNIKVLKSDQRIMDLLMKINHDFFPHLNITPNFLLSKDVDSASVYFPPCMLNLHQSLRTRHRLSHSQRFYYSLFLKDIGMPVQEAIDFWRIEYKQNPSGSHTCCHSWEKDEKKYLYGIRHMYGLEGGRKNYTSVNCDRIQSLDNACSEGGCPFKSFDHVKMLQVLGAQSQTLLSQVYDFKKKNQPTAACRFYLDYVHAKTNYCDNFSFNFSPVKYYLTATAVSK